MGNSCFLLLYQFGTQDLYFPRCGEIELCVAFGEVHDANRNAFCNLQGVTEPDAFYLERGQDPHFAEPAAHIEDVNVFRYSVDDQPHGLAARLGRPCVSIRDWSYVILDDFEFAVAGVVKRGDTFFSG